MSGDYAHKTEVIEAEAWSAFHGSYRALCQNCNWRGEWAVDPFAARRDGHTHTIEVFQ